MNEETRFKQWASSLEKDIVIGQDPVELFAWALEDEYEARMSEALEYFSQRPDFLKQECVEHLIELDRLETRFVEIEQYEKCAVIRDLKTELKIRYKQWL
jgi:hypothetical protein